MFKFNIQVQVRKKLTILIVKNVFDGAGLSVWSLGGLIFQHLLHRDEQPY